MARDLEKFFNKITSGRDDSRRRAGRIASEVRHILDSVAKTDGQLTFSFVNDSRKGEKEIETFLAENFSIIRQAGFGDLLERFSRMPHCLSERETIAAVAGLLARDKIVLSMDNEAVEKADVPKILADSGSRGGLTLYGKIPAGKKEAAKASQAGRMLFGDGFPGDSADLAGRLRLELKTWLKTLGDRLDDVNGRHYPAKGAVYQGRRLILKLLSVVEPADLIHAFNESLDELAEIKASLGELKAFRENIETWDKLTGAVDYFGKNKPMLEKDAAAAALYNRMVEISATPKPSLLFSEIDGLVARVQDINERLLVENRNRLLSEIDGKIESLRKKLDMHGCSPQVRNQALHPVRLLRKKAESEMFYPGIKEIERQLLDHCEQFVDIIESC